MQQSQPIRVIARIRARKDESEESCLSVEGKLLVVNPTTTEDVPSSVSRRQSVRRSSLTGGRKSSIGCSSLIPRTPHTPRGLLRNVLSVFPVLEQDSAQTERFQMHSIVPEEGSQADVFNMMVPEVQAAVDGFRSTILCYGVADSGKSYTLWGTQGEKGLTARALEYVFAHIPEGTKVAVSFVGLDDTSCLDYLADVKQPLAIPNPVFKDGADGGKTVQKTTTLIVNDAESAWDVLFGGLGKMRSDYHQILTITLNVPSSNGGCLIGTLQIGEICLPATDEVMTRNTSAMHEIVRDLVDKKYEGSVDFGKSLLTTMLQPAFGGNSRTVVMLNVHPTLQHYHNTIATLSFGEHCSKLKNVIAQHTVQGVSNPSHLVGSAPADLVRQVNEYCVYVEELEAENDDLRDRCKAWEARVADGDRRHNLALSRAKEAYETQMAEARVAVEELQLQLDSEKLITNGQVLIIARQEKMLQRLGGVSGVGLVEVDNSQVEELVSKVQELERKLADAQRINRGSRIGVVETPTSAPDVPMNLQFLQAQLRRVQAENEALKRSLSTNPGRGAAGDEEEEERSLGEHELHARISKQKIALAKRDEELREMREEMRLKEQEMAERELQVEELSDRCDVLRSQLLTVKILKASATNVSGRPGTSSSVTSSHANSSSNRSNQIDAAKAEVANRIKSRAKAQAQAKLNGSKAAPSQADVQKRPVHRQVIQEEAASLSSSMEEEEEEPIAVAKPVQKKKRAAPKPKPVEVAQEQEEEERIEVSRPAVVPKKKKVVATRTIAAVEAAPVPQEPPKKKPVAKKPKPVVDAAPTVVPASIEMDSQDTEPPAQQQNAPEQQAAHVATSSPPRGDDLMDPLDSALLRVPEQAAREIERPPMPLAPPPQPSRAAPRESARPAKDLNTSSFFGPTASLLDGIDADSDGDDDVDDIVTPVPKASKAASKSKVATKKRSSPNENAKKPNSNASVAPEAAAAQPGKRKLMNVKKQRGADFRKSLAATPASVHPSKSQSRAVEKLTGVTDYGSMLSSVLNEGLFALKTPAK